MSEIGLSFAQKLLAKEHRGSTARLKDKEPDPEFVQALATSVRKMVLMSEATIPIIDPTITVEHEGTVGFLPPGAKAEVGRAMIRGHEPPPVRLVEEEVSSGIPKRQVDSVTLHLIHAVDPVTSGSANKQERLHTTLAALKVLLSHNGEEEIPGSTPDNPSIRIRKKEAVLHLIKKDVAGHYMVEPITINGADDIEAATDRYTAALDWVLQRHPEARLGSTSLDPLIVGHKLDAEIRRANDPSHIALPVGITSSDINPDFIMPLDTKLIGLNYDGIPQISRFQKQYGRTVLSTMKDE